jgi:hypothetical protein
MHRPCDIVKGCKDNAQTTFPRPVASKAPRRIKHCKKTQESLRCTPSPADRRDIDMEPIEFFELVTQKSPKEVIEADFPAVAPLHVRGGWGYGKDTACIVEAETPAGRPVDPVRVEYIFAEYRLYEELIVFR